MTVQAEDTIEVASGDTYVIANGDPLALDFTDVLGSATIASVDNVSIDKTGLTLDNEAVNTSTFTMTKKVDGVDTSVTIAIGKAVWIDKAAGSTPKLYTVRVSVTTSTGSKREGEFKINVG